jgi:MacB-like periplasmic core domain
MFNAADQMGSPRVAMINRRLARELFGDTDPVGRRIVGCGPSASVIVGVTDDIRANGLDQDIRDEVYLPSTQWVQSGMMLVVRGSVPVMTLTPAIRRVVSAADPALPVGAPGHARRSPRRDASHLRAGLLLPGGHVYCSIPAGGSPCHHARRANTR